MSTVLRMIASFMCRGWECERVRNKDSSVKDSSTRAREDTWLWQGQIQRQATKSTIPNGKFNGNRTAFSKIRHVRKNHCRFLPLEADPSYFQLSHMSCTTYIPKVLQHYVGIEVILQAEVCSSSSNSLLQLLLAMEKRCFLWGCFFFNSVLLVAWHQIFVVVGTNRTHVFSLNLSAAYLDRILRVADIPRPTYSAEQACAKHPNPKTLQRACRSFLFL